MSRRGFTLTELVVFCAVVTALSVALLPQALKPRARLNEEHARHYLRMIASSQAAWTRLGGGPRELWELANTVPPAARDDLPDLRTPLLPPAMVPYEGGIAHRGGYRFRVGRDGDGAIVGCWAWPSLRRYSGLRTYWIDFADGRVHVAEVEASWDDDPGFRAPERDALRPLGDA